MKKWLTLLALSAGLSSTGNAAYINRLKTFTGTASQWPWQLNADGTWTFKRPDASDVTFTQSGTGAIASNANDKLKEQMISARDFGAKCDGATDDTAAIQKAGNAAILLGMTLYIPPGVCIVSQNGAHVYALQFVGQIKIFGVPGYSVIMPATTMSDSVHVLYLIGDGNSASRTVIDGLFIGNPSSSTRYGGDGIVFDTTAAGANFAQPEIKNSYIQSNAAGTGWSVFAINSAANNPNGGFYLAAFYNNRFPGGVALINSGDSIHFDKMSFFGNALNPGIYASLVNGAGGMAGNLTIRDSNSSARGGAVVVDCSASVIIDANEFEQAVTSSETNNALIDLAGGNCNIPKSVVTNNQLQANSGTGSPILARVANATGTLIDGNRIATPTDYVPVIVTAAATDTVIGPGNTWVGNTVHVTNSGTGTVETVNVPYGSGGTSQVLKRTSSGGAVTVAQLSPGELSTIAGNTFLGNVSNSTANPVAAPLPSCTGSGSVMQYVLGTGWGCHAIVPADLPVATTSALGVVKTDGSTLANTAGAISVNATTINGTSCTPGSTCNVNASYTNSLGSDLTMPVAGTYVDGPSVAQGSTGTWFASGTVTLDDTTNSAVYNCKLWDGTTTIARATHTLSAASYYTSISLSGVITSPAGNLRISCNEQFQTTGVMKATDIGGATKASTITAVRIN